MTWSYSGNPAESLKDQVRFLLGDTNTAAPQIQDEEIMYLLSQESSNALRAAARGAETLAARYAREADKKVGDMMLNSSVVGKGYATLAKNLWRTYYSRTVSPYAGGISVADKKANEEDQDREKMPIREDMMRYPFEPIFSNNPEELLH